MTYSGYDSVNNAPRAGTDTLTMPSSTAGIGTAGAGGTAIPQQIAVAGIQDIPQRSTSGQVGTQRGGPFTLSGDMGKTGTSTTGASAPGTSGVGTLNLIGDTIPAGEGSSKGFGSWSIASRYGAGTLNLSGNTASSAGSSLTGLDFLANVQSSGYNYDSPGIMDFNLFLTGGSGILTGGETGISNPGEGNAFTSQGLLARLNFGIAGLDGGYSALDAGTLFGRSSYFMDYNLSALADLNLTKKEGNTDVSSIGGPLFDRNVSMPDPAAQAAIDFNKAETMRNVCANIATPAYVTNIGRRATEDVNKRAFNTLVDLYGYADYEDILELTLLGYDIDPIDIIESDPIAAKAFNNAVLSRISALPAGAEIKGTVILEGTNLTQIGRDIHRIFGGTSTHTLGEFTLTQEVRANLRPGDVVGLKINSRTKGVLEGWARVESIGKDRSITFSGGCMDLSGIVTSIKNTHSGFDSSIVDVDRAMAVDISFKLGANNSSTNILNFNFAVAVTGNNVIEQHIQPGGAGGAMAGGASTTAFVSGFAQGWDKTLIYSNGVVILNLKGEVVQKLGDILMVSRTDTDGVPMIPTSLFSPAMNMYAGGMIRTKDGPAPLNNSRWDIRTNEIGLTGAYAATDGAGNYGIVMPNSRVSELMTDGLTLGRTADGKPALEMNYINVTTGNVFDGKYIFITGITGDLTVNKDSNFASGYGIPVDNTASETISVPFAINLNDMSVHAYILPSSGLGIISGHAGTTIKPNLTMQGEAIFGVVQSFLAEKNKIGNISIIRADCRVRTLNSIYDSGVDHNSLPFNNISGTGGGSGASLREIGVTVLDDGHIGILPGQIFTMERGSFVLQNSDIIMNMSDPHGRGFYYDGNIRIEGFRAISAGQSGGLYAIKKDGKAGKVLITTDKPYLNRVLPNIDGEPGISQYTVLNKNNGVFSYDILNKVGDRTVAEVFQYGGRYIPAFRETQGNESWLSVQSNAYDLNVTQDVAGSTLTFRLTGSESADSPYFTLSSALKCNINAGELTLRYDRKVLGMVQGDTTISGTLNLVNHTFSTTDEVPIQSGSLTYNQTGGTWSFGNNGFTVSSFNNTITNTAWAGSTFWTNPSDAGAVWCKSAGSGDASGLMGMLRTAGWENVTSREGNLTLKTFNDPSARGGYGIYITEIRNSQNVLVSIPGIRYQDDYGNVTMPALGFISQIMSDVDSVNKGVSYNADPNKYMQNMDSTLRLTMASAGFDSYAVTVDYLRGVKLDISGNPVDGGLTAYMRYDFTRVQTDSVYKQPGSNVMITALVPRDPNAPENGYSMSFNWTAQASDAKGITLSLKEVHNRLGEWASNKYAWPL
jgi:hypothetical protein